MANINKVELNLGHKIANPFKTTRKSDTNPFKYSNFEGNTLQFADVFEGFEPKNVNKMKLVMSSVIGSMTKFRNSITEPIVNFVNRVREGISGAWAYAKNTNVEIAGIKKLTESIHNTKESIHNSISGIGKNITDRISVINEDITGIGKELSAKWNSLIEKVHPNKISSDMPVAELRELWINENTLAEKTAELVKEAA